MLTRRVDRVADDLGGRDGRSPTDVSARELTAERPLVPSIGLGRS